MNRATRRAMKKNISKDANEKLSNQVAQFGKLPEFCDLCSQAFDKKDKEMVKSWSVVVKQDVVRLFCPDCMNKAKEVINGSSKNITSST
tara:strand:- start:9771 stop:10037 length:267 start_codon:yes stop_codon:yes gene_type:complete